MNKHVSPGTCIVIAFLAFMFGLFLAHSATNSFLQKGIKNGYIVIEDMNYKLAPADLIVKEKQ